MMTLSCELPVKDSPDIHSRESAFVKEGGCHCPSVVSEPGGRGARARHRSNALLLQQETDVLRMLIESQLDVLEGDTGPALRSLNPTQPALQKVLTHWALLPPG